MAGFSSFFFSVINKQTQFNQHIVTTQQIHQDNIRTHTHTPKHSVLKIDPVV